MVVLFLFSTGDGDVDVFGACVGAMLSVLLVLLWCCLLEVLLVVVIMWWCCCCIPSSTLVPLLCAFLAYLVGLASPRGRGS